MVRDELKCGVGAHEFDRYKILVQIVLGEMKGQGLRIMSKSLWDSRYDNYSTYTYKNV